MKTIEQSFVATNPETGEIKGFTVDLPFWQRYAGRILAEEIFWENAEIKVYPDCPNCWVFFGRSKQPSRELRI